MAYDLHLAERVQSILERGGEFSERKMFGGVAFMVNGHMCCGILKTDLVLRLTPEEAAAALRQPHTRPMDFTGKPMKSMIYVSAMETWVQSALKAARSRPDKKASRQAARGRQRAN
jgi:TfoX/Sxy family transcriptional regulator of competence genes